MCELRQAVLLCLFFPGFFHPVHLKPEGASHAFLGFNTEFEAVKNEYLLDDGKT